MSWRRWAGATSYTVAAVVAAIVTLALTHWVQRRFDRAFASRIARTTGAYIAVITPPPPPPPPPRPARRPIRATRPRVVPQRAPADTAQRAEASARSRGYYLPQLLTNARALETLPGWTSDVEVYYGTAPLVDATAPPLTPDDLVDLDTLGREGRWRAGRALVPLRDHDGREVVGAVAARPRSLPRGPLPGGIGFAVPAALLAIGVAAAIAFRERPLRRGGYAFAALVLGVAAYADVRAAARQSTDRWLTDTRRLVQEGATRLPPARLRFALTDLAPLMQDAELVTGEPAEAAPRRLRTDGRRQAVVAGLIGAGRWIEVRTVPAEDGTWGWLVVLLACAFSGPVAIWSLRWAERTPQRRRRETAIAWGFLAPAAGHLLIFTAAPFVAAIYLALHPIGLASLSNVMRDPATLAALRNSAVYVLYVPLSVAIALALALGVNGVRHRWGARVLRSMLLLPYVSSIVAVALIWQLIYQTGSLGLGRTDWLSGSRTALLALMLLALWVHIGGQMLVFLAALQRIPVEYLEAARVDGANAWRRFWRVIFPLLRPVTAFVLVTGVVTAFQLFTYVYVLTGGTRTDVVVHRIYELAWGGGNAFGPASSIALLLFFILLVLSWPRLRLLGTRVEHA